MRIKRACKICGDHFSAIKITQFFCSRRCFKRDYYVRTKTRLEIEGRKKKYPSKECLYCGAMNELTFDPLVKPELFRSWACPECGVSNELAWRHQYDPRSQQVIAQILITFESRVEITQVQQPKELQTYHIPLMNPEMGNPDILVMACELMDMLSSHKQKRKRIVFS